MVQDNDSHGAPRRAGLCRDLIREGPSRHRVFRRLAGICQGGVSAVLPTRVAHVDSGLIKRGRLNLKTIIGLYRELGEFIEAMDAEAQARGELEDESIDADFRSGVYLGVGSSHIILSLMPGKILAIVELFGYKGDRMTGLMYLNKSGGWSSDSPRPSVSKGTLEPRSCTRFLTPSLECEGLRRPISDMSLLIFHLVLSGITFNGVDINMAQKILDWNLERYPNGMLLVLQWLFSM